MMANVGSIGRLGRLMLGVALLGLLFERGESLRWSSSLVSFRC
jgi:hypothetical protein